MGDEAVQMQRKAKPTLGASGIANTDRDRGRAMSDVRTSTMTFLRIDHDDRLKARRRPLHTASNRARMAPTSHPHPHPT